MCQFGSVTFHLRERTVSLAWRWRLDPYSLLPTDNEWNSTHHFVEYTLPLEEGGAAPNGLISLAVWLPDVPEGMQVPVIAERVLTSRKPASKPLRLKFPEVGWGRCSLTKFYRTAMLLPKSQSQAPDGAITTHGFDG